MKCSYHRQLADYQVGRLPSAPLARLEAHLTTCASCRRELAALQATAALLRPMPLRDAPAATWGRVQARLTPRRSPAATRVRQWAPAFAAVMVLLIIAAALIPMTHTAPVPQQLADTDGYSQVQLAAAWDSPLADRAALGLAMIALDDDATAAESWN
ncbi:MAG: zf-HC2 domain-containing protein [Armatimonadota bacterium]